MRGALPSGDRRQRHAGGGLGGHAEAHERRLQAGGGGDEGDVTVGEHRHADADADTVDRGEQRLGKRLEHRHEQLIARRVELGERFGVGHLGQVHARREGAAVAGQHDAVDGVVLGGVGEGLGHGLPQRLAEGVERLGPVEAQQPDAVGIDDLEHASRSERHGFLLGESFGPGHGPNDLEFSQVTGAIGR